MASLSEDHCSVSPKRIKLEDTDLKCKTDSEPCLNSFSLSHDGVEQQIGGREQPFLMDPDFLMEDQTGKETPEFDNGDNDEEEGDVDDDDADDDASSTVSSVSNLSGLSEMSGRQWKPIESLMRVEKLMMKGISPRDVFCQITGDATPLPDSISDMALWKIIAAYLTESPRRTRLSNVTTFENVVHLLKTCSKIIVLTGAGVSVSCGIPDFRSKDGVYARLAVDFPDLPDPQAMFDINYFRQDPRPFFKFACEIFPGQFKPSPCHRFIKMLERQKKLLRNYTQNIDTLEKVAGIENVVECHGSFATATCTRCGHSVSSEEIREEIFKQQIPVCPKCSVNATTESEKGVMKPDIVFFGEGLPESFHDAMGKDKDECDLLIVIGSSLKVRPVALIPCSLPSNVPQILINRERLPHLNFDVELLGDSDFIIDHLCHLLGDEWKEICWRDNPLKDCSNLFPIPDCKSDSNYSSSDEQSENETDPVEVKCQRIGRRIGGEDNTRHMSLDSSRDSGIGESSNSSNERSPSPTSQAEVFLPKDCYYQIKKRRYVFPGAEVFQQHRPRETSSD